MSSLNKTLTSILILILFLLKEKGDRQIIVELKSGINYSFLQH